MTRAEIIATGFVVWLILIVLIVRWFGEITR